MVSRLLWSVFACALLVVAPAAQAQNFPSGPVRIIVPFPAGGATDVLGRVLSVHLQNLWGSPVITEYRPGAAGLIGTRQVAGAAADGVHDVRRFVGNHPQSDDMCVTCFGRVR